MQAPLDYATTAVRPAWAELPKSVRALVCRRLGSEVVDASSQRAGFTPGFASRLVCADGGRAFVKAASSRTDPTIAGCYRDEARIVAALPPGLPVPALRWVAEDEEWVVLCFTDVPGHPPHRPWRRPELDRLLDVLAELAAALSPAPARLRVPTMAEALAGDLTGWRSLHDAGTDLTGLLGAGAWPAGQLEALMELEAEAAERCAGETLAHLDLRPDNVIVGDDAAVYVCDWNWACTAAPWVDLVCLLPSAFADGFDAQALLLTHPAGRTAPPRSVDALLAALAGFYARAGRKPAVPSSPSLRAHQRAYGAATLGWLRQRVERL